MIKKCRFLTSLNKWNIFIERNWREDQEIDIKTISDAITFRLQALKQRKSQTVRGQSKRTSPGEGEGGSPKMVANDGSTVFGGRSFKKSLLRFARWFHGWYLVGTWKK